MAGLLSNSEYILEKHPWNWYAPPDSKSLVIGTFPSALKNRKYDFYYPNPANFFWRIMSEISGIPLLHFSGEQAVIERKNILTKLHLAISDMGKTIARYKESSLDEHLEVREYMEIFKILEENPSIEKIIFTSSSGNSSAAKWFLQYLNSMGIKHKFPKERKPVRSEFIFNDRKISLVIAFSPSPRAANRITFEKLVEIYRNEILYLV